MSILLGLPFPHPERRRVISGMVLGVLFFGLLLARARWKWSRLREQRERRQQSEARRLRERVDPRI
jgi:hypothetical protein